MVLTIIVVIIIIIIIIIVIIIIVIIIIMIMIIIMIIIITIIIIITNDARTHVKDPVVHVSIRWITETRKHCTQEFKKKRVAPYYGCSLSKGKAARISSALHWDQKSNLI